MFAPFKKTLSCDYPTGSAMNNYGKRSARNNYGKECVLTRGRKVSFSAEMDFLKILTPQYAARWRTP